MLEKFLTYNQKERIVPYQGKMLLAVSGGKDSVCMARLFAQAGLEFAIVHCNFQLRGRDSDEDEVFVKALASELGVEVFTTKFATEVYAKEHHISTQMAARDLRYAYFQELIEEHGFVGIATAHHADDVVETMILNLSRGTGLSGMHGILPVRNNVFRPLLFASTDEIITYLNTNSFLWREDTSNASDKYKRNLVRHKILPILAELNPKYREAFSGFAQQVKIAEEFIEDHVDSVLRQVVTERGQEVEVDLRHIKEADHGLLLLDGILSKYDVAFHQVRRIYENLNSISGTQLEIEGAKVIIDRDRLFLTSVAIEEVGTVTISGPGEYRIGPVQIEVIREKVNLNTIDRSPECAYLDEAKITEPLRLRKWKLGDRFRPLGMKGMKKVSDFLIDEKVPLHYKDRIMVLVHGTDIVWLAGYRISDDYKLGLGETSVLKLKLKES